MTSAFLDNGVVLAYCIVCHQFHPECDEFIEESELDICITEDINSIYEKKKEEVINELSTDILEHQADIKRGDFLEQLGPTDLRDVANMIHSSNDARRFLLNWYEDEIDQFINKYELTERLRNLAGDIEQRAQERKSQFDSHTGKWERNSGKDYPDIQDELDEIRESKVEDMWVCIDAHDLAVSLEDRTIIATTDLNDFIRGGRRELIIDATAIDDVVQVTNISA